LSSHLCLGFSSSFFLYRFSKQNFVRSSHVSKVFYVPFRIIRLRVIALLIMYRKRTGVITWTKQLTYRSHRDLQIVFFSTWTQGSFPSTAPLPVTDITMPCERSPCQPLKAQWLLYVPPALTYQNSTFCPQSVSVCSVWFSQ
jgi:hypothetical protein